jgi:hypothetical protein
MRDLHVEFWRKWVNLTKANAYPAEHTPNVVKLKI